MCDKSECAGVAGRVRTAAVVSFGILVLTQINIDQKWREDWVDRSVAELYKCDYLATDQSTDIEMISVPVLALFAPILMPPSGADRSFQLMAARSLTLISSRHTRLADSPLKSHFSSLAFQPQIRGLILPFVTFMRLLICFDSCFHSCSTLELCGKLFLKQS